MATISVPAQRSGRLAAASRNGRGWTAAINVTIGLGLVGLWWLASLGSPYVASPPATVGAVREAFVDGWLVEALASTLQGVLVGFLCAAVLGIVLGYLLATWPFFGAVMMPLVQAYGGIPRIVFLPILLVLFGVGMTTKVWMAVLAAFFPIVVNVAAAIAATPPAIQRLAAALEVGPLTMAFKLRMRGAVPAIVVGLRLGLSSAILAVVVTEFFGSPDGLGVELASAYAALDYERLFGIVAVVLVIALGTNAVFALVEKKFRY